MPNIYRSAFLARAAALTLLLSGACAISFAKETPLNYLAAEQISAEQLLPPPPAGIEQLAELDTVRSVYHAASEADKKAAHGEKKFTVFNFTGAAGDFFVATNLPKTTAFFEKVQRDAATITDAGKDYFQRPRPYVADPNLANGKLETSFSYPSGHSTESMTLALVLADMLPEKHDAIIAHANLIGWHRVEIARHYPSDIQAGRILARAIVRELKKSGAFQKDFAEAKAEIEAAQTAAK